MEHEQIIATVDRLVDDWCEVRNLTALRHILAAFPVRGTSPQDWNHLRDALQNVQSACGDDLSAEQKGDVQDLLASLPGRTAH